jgi:hypothetical protein
VIQKAKPTAYSASIFCLWKGGRDVLMRSVGPVILWPPLRGFVFYFFSSRRLGPYSHASTLGGVDLKCVCTPHQVAQFAESVGAGIKI